MIPPERKPKTQSSAAGGPPRPPKKTVVGFSGDGDEPPDPLRPLSLEERRQLAESLKKTVSKPDEAA